MEQRSTRLLKSYCLSLMMGGVALLVGFVGGTWLPPMVVMLLGDHKLSFADFPLQVGVIPSVPNTISPKADRNQFLFLDKAGVFLGIFCAAILVRYALRFSHYLVVRKFRWLTLEEAERL